MFDRHGDRLTGDCKRYVIEFSRGQTPPVMFFWSLTMYRFSDGMLVENWLSRYSIGDRTRGLHYGANGTLQLNIQHVPPSEDQYVNWLPAPAEPFFLVLRLYEPKEDAAPRRWVPPSFLELPG